MSIFTLTCSNQRKQRQQYIKHEVNTYERATIVSPYNYNLSGELIYTQYDLDMRRKAEILKYKNSNNNNNRNRNFAYLSNTNNMRRSCPDVNKPLSTSSSNVPGKPIILYYDDKIPLYNYKNSTNAIAYQNIKYDDYNRPYDLFPYYNITSNNGQESTFLELVIVNPDKNILSFGFNVPVSLAYKAYFDASLSINPINCIQLYIASAKMDIYYSDYIQSTVNIPYSSFSDDDVNDIKPFLSTDLFVSCNVVTVNFDQSVTGEVNVTQLLGSIYIPSMNIAAVTQYVYTYKLTANIAYSEYSVQDISRNAYRTNYKDGVIVNESISINSVPPPSSLTDIKISTITNVENVILVTNNNPIQNSFLNCAVSISNIELISPADISYNYNYINQEDVVYIPLQISAS